MGVDGVNEVSLVGGGSSIRDLKYLSSSVVPLATTARLRVRRGLPSSWIDCKFSMFPILNGRLKKDGTV